MVISRWGCYYSNCIVTRIAQLGWWLQNKYKHTHKQMSETYSSKLTLYFDVCACVCVYWVLIVRNFVEDIDILIMPTYLTYLNIVLYITCNVLNKAKSEEHNVWRFLSRPVECSRQLQLPLLHSLLGICSFGVLIITAFTGLAVSAYIQFKTFLNRTKTLSYKTIKK